MELQVREDSLMETIREGGASPGRVTGQVPFLGSLSLGL